jgi:hypothetical protein
MVGEFGLNQLKLMGQWFILPCTLISYTAVLHPIAVSGKMGIFLNTHRYGVGGVEERTTVRNEGLESSEKME